MDNLVSLYDLKWCEQSIVLSRLITFFEGIKSLGVFASRGRAWHATPNVYLKHGCCAGSLNRLIAVDSEEYR